MATMTDTTTTALAHLGDTWRGITAAWLSEVAGRTGSPRTPQEYGRYLGRFLELAGDPARATPAYVHAFAYAPGPSGREPSPSTVIVRLAALQGFYDFARRMGAVERNPAQDVKRPRNRQAVPRGLEAEELKRLLAAIPQDSPVGKRDRAMIITAVLTGLRRQELLGLRRGDLTVNGAVYYRARTKGGTERRRELPPPALQAILEALEAQGRPLEGLAQEERIFNVSHMTFYAYLRRYAKRAGLGQVKPHDLRHSAAKLRREHGASLEEVSAFLGHKDLATTARYLARLEGERDNGWQGAAAALGIA